MAFFGLFKSKPESLDKGLAKTREGFLGRLGRALLGKTTVDADVLDQLEETLVAADVGVSTTLKIIGQIEARIARDKYMNTAELHGILKSEIRSLLTQPADDQADKTGPYTIMVVGVNGVGKTTTIGKLAHQFSASGKKVVVGAADTFRAAAIDQLKVWAQRANVPVISQQMGADPASVAFDALQSAIAQRADVLIIDTAGRLHNKQGLMAELSKIKRVMQKLLPDAPHEVLLVLDGTTGQNAFEQAKQFTEATDVNAIAITKLDGTAKGGVVIGISDQFRVPVKYIGVGEKVDDLQLFDPELFVDSLFNER